MKRVTAQSRNDSAASTSTADNTQSEQTCSQSHPTDAELLHWMAECPFALDHLAKKSRERLRIRALLSRWQALGCPDPVQLREQTSADDFQQPPLSHEQIDPSHPSGAC